MNIARITELLKRLPDADIQRMTSSPSPSPDVPTWALAMETNRRNRLRQAQSAAPPTVAPQVGQQIAMQRPVQTQLPQPGAQSQASGIRAAQPRGYAGGGIVAFKNGGEVKRYAEGGYVAKARSLGNEEVESEAEAYKWLAARYMAEQSAAAQSVAGGPYGPGVTAPTVPSTREPISTPLDANRGLIPSPFLADRALISRPPLPEGGNLIPSQVKPGSGLPAAPSYFRSATPPTKKRPPATSDAEATGIAAATPITRSASPGFKPVQVGIGELTQLPQLPDVDVMSRVAEMEGYRGEDKYAAGIAAELARREAALEKTRGGLETAFWRDWGPAMLAESSKSGATFSGALGGATQAALGEHKARKEKLTTEKTGVHQAKLAEIGRKQTEKYADIAEAVKGRDARATENQKRVLANVDILNNRVFENAKLQQDAAKLTAQMAQQTQQFERAMASDNLREATAVLSNLAAVAKGYESEYKLAQASGLSSPEDLVAAKQLWDNARGAHAKATLDLADKKGVSAGALAKKDGAGNLGRV